MSLEYLEYVVDVLCDVEALLKKEETTLKAELDRAKQQCVPHNEQAALALRIMEIQKRDRAVVQAVRRCYDMIENGRKESDGNHRSAAVPVTRSSAV